MFRYRRYRVFVAFAVVTIFALYKFGSTGSWREAALLSTGEKPPPVEEAPDAQVPPLSWLAKPHEVVKETKKLQVEVSGIETALAQPLATPPPIASVSHPVQKAPPGSPQSEHKEQAASPMATPTTTGTPKGMGQLDDEPKLFIPGHGDILHEHGEGRNEVEPLPTNAEPIHWRPRPDHFPIPSESTIQLPAGSPKPIPKIQFQFNEETPEAKGDRLSKLKVIKDTFLHSWTGYKEKAWMKDELSPVSGGFRNPFAGWGATLVDSLDTLWMMGLKSEFEEAVEAVKEIDFTTSPRGDIPMFETTIRYLGGLVAAYDISDKKYKILLEKAIELAEILMGAFDTPNRMPVTYYYWRPTFASQPHRASSNVVLAEIGSLSVEFTRLAQLTGEPKYYDAIARITNALEVFQNQTRLPGMWPTYIDASGCKRPSVSYTIDDETPLEESEIEEVSEEISSVVDAQPAKTSAAEFDADEMVPVELPKPITFEVIDGKDADKKSPAKAKRQLDDAPEASIAPRTAVNAAPKAKATIPPVPECEEQGMVSTSDFGSESYTLGGMSDSTYEYLPKQYLLLNGLVDQYRTMYEKSVDVVKEQLLFRPMLPNSDDILFSGSLSVPATPYEDSDKKGELEHENAHLTCFAGGMFAMGAKIFNREEDLEIAKKLTEGCVWSYNATSTGIMPESFYVAACESQKGCEWNQTKYWQRIDPYAEGRLKSYEDQMIRYEKLLEEASSSYAMEMAAATGVPEATGLVEKAVETEAATIEAEPTEAPKAASLKRRQLDAADEKAENPSKTEKKEEGDEEEAPPQASTTPSSTLPSFPILYSPRPPLSHEEYVQNRIQEERLPEGITSIRSKKYILRPEAIESVFYLYRITGSSHWREVGWDMFQAIAAHTTTEYGNSAIDDVTKTAPELMDEMESFWLAETLKYFYLLFSEESAVSLDDWVLNTEAHPFRRGA